MTDTVPRTTVKQPSKYGKALAVIASLLAGVLWHQANADRIIVINHTDSLPHLAFIIDRRQAPDIGDLVYFAPPENRFYGTLPFVKRVVAGPGDTITIRDKSLFVNGEPLCRLLDVARDGSPLHPGPTGLIPDDHYFLYSTHERSYDSRYKDIGWVPANRIIGTVVKTIF